MANSIDKLKQFISGDEAVIIEQPASRVYLCGMETSNGMIIATHSQAAFFTDFRYITAAHDKVDSIMEVALFDGSHAETAAKYLKDKNISKISLENNFLSFNAANEFMNELKGCEFCDGSEYVPSLRVTKTQQELDSIIAAQMVTDLGYSYILRYVADNWKNGLTEKEIALELEFYMRKNGSGEMPFDIICASGENTACPHAVPSERKLCDGDFVTLDFGSTVNGYCSDMTRTFAVGHATEEMMNIYDTVLTAQRMCIKEIKAGVIGRDIDAIARDYFKSLGYGEYFGHGLGHAVGLQIHEEPRFSPTCTAIMQENSVLSVEPGIYIAHKFGVRIEDLVIIKHDNCIDITESEKKLIIV